MKGDFSRRTFDAARHYAAVTMQQGRVQLDADWNEQAEITRHRAQTETLDTVGRCGGPLHDAAFGLVKPAGLSRAEQDYVKARWKALGKGDFLLSPGRYYVDGILVESEHAVPFAQQPDLPGARPLPGDNGDYLLYLDVWERHLTALEEPSVPALKDRAVPLREIALGGPDTASRVRVVWQVRAVKVAQQTCLPVPGEYEAATAPTTGRVRMRAAAASIPGDPCVVPAGSGYRGLENQLYRVEIHDAGTPLSHATVAGELVTSWDPDPAKRTLTLAALPAGLAVGSAVELYHATAKDPVKGTVAYVTGVTGKTVTLNATFDEPVKADEPRVRLLQATAKWSRDNGVVLAKVGSIDPATREVVVESFGVDDVLSIHVDEWVEIFDDSHDLTATPGRLYQVESRNDATRTLVLRTTPATLGGTGGVTPDLNPRIRRWDGLLAVKTDLPGDGWQELEDGVQVQFQDGTYRTGEWWNAAARTATAQSQSGTLEWPDGLDGLPELRRPAGIEHHYCRLGVVHSSRAGAVTLLQDCRCFFAPLTELNSLEYVGGAGQEAMPNPAAAGERVELGLPLIAGVPNAHCHEQPASVRFTVTRGDGRLSAAQGGAAAGTAAVDVPLDPDGLARCWWALAGDYDPGDDSTLHQTVEARLLENGVPVQLPVIFNASLSVAHQVSYDPGGCKGLAGQVTVQRAIDRLAHAVSLYPDGGDGQEARPEQKLPCLLMVRAASVCGPAERQPVRFTVEGGGRLDGVNNQGIAVTDSDGIAEVSWTLGRSGCQRVIATLVMPDERSAEPRSVVFNATLSTAGEVAYTPDEKCEMAKEGVETVQQALDWLCAHRGHGGGCSVTVGEGGDFATLPQALELLKTRDAVNVCLLPGIHRVSQPLNLSKGNGSVKITGNALATPLLFEQEGRLIAAPLGELVLRDLVIVTTTAPVVVVNACWDFVVERCFVFLQEGHQEALITVQQCVRTRIAGNQMWAPAPPAPQRGTVVARATALREDFLRSVREMTLEPRLAVERLAMRSAVERGGVIGMQSAHPTGAGLRTPPTVGDVLALMDGGGTTYVKDNLFAGNVRMYGQGGALSLSALNSNVLDRVRGGQAELSHQGGALYLHANQLHRVLLDAGVLAITNPPAGTGAAIPYRICSVSENAFFDGFSQVLAAQVNLGHNHWVQGVGGDVMVAAGHLASVLGNAAVVSDSASLWLATRGGVAPQDSNWVAIRVVF